MVVVNLYTHAFYAGDDSCLTLRNVLLRARPLGVVIVVLAKVPCLVIAFE